MAEENVMCPNCEVRALVNGKCLVCGYGTTKDEAGKASEKPKKEK